MPKIAHFVVTPKKAPLPRGFFFYNHLLRGLGAKSPKVFVTFAYLCVLAVEGLSLRACTVGAA